MSLTAALLDGLLGYVYLIILLTFHEFAHAWVAWKCGDDTARSRGRVTLNPIAHIDAVGTVLLPILVIVLSITGSGLARFIIGWGKPVPVDPRNLRHPRFQDTLIALAGPAINLALALLLVVVARAVCRLDLTERVQLAVLTPPMTMALISLMLCFFNLLPIPPLDGSHLIKNLIGMSDATYLKLSAVGFILVIVVLQFQPVRWLLSTVTIRTLHGFEALAGLVL